MAARRVIELQDRIIKLSCIKEKTQSDITELEEAHGLLVDAQNEWAEAHKEIDNKCKSIKKSDSDVTDPGKAKAAPPAPPLADIAVHGWSKTSEVPVAEKPAEKSVESVAGSSSDKFKQRKRVSIDESRNERIEAAADDSESYEFYSYTDSDKSRAGSEADPDKIDEEPEGGYASEDDDEHFIRLDKEMANKYKEKRKKDALEGISIPTHEALEMDLDSCAAKLNALKIGRIKEKVSEGGKKVRKIKEKRCPYGKSCTLGLKCPGNHTKAALQYFKERDGGEIESIEGKGDDSRKLAKAKSRPKKNEDKKDKVEDDKKSKPKKRIRKIRVNQDGDEMPPKRNLMGPHSKYGKWSDDGNHWGAWILVGIYM